PRCSDSSSGHVVPRHVLPCPWRRRSYRLFFLSCCGDHRALHSFPTRRSSDLTSPSGSLAATLPAQSGPRKSMRSMRGRSSTRLRSEEHTSELQSPYDLVCRLLLEKKKI